MSAIKVEIINIHEFHDVIARLTEAARGNVLRDGVDAGGWELRDEIRIHIEKQGLVDTGNLINSVEKKDAVVSGDSASVEVGTNVPYAAIHEFGGVIKAKNDGYLTFQTKDGAWHKVKSVTMPARPYMRPAVDEGKPRVEQAIKIALQAAIEAAI